MFLVGVYLLDMVVLRIVDVGRDIIEVYRTGTLRMLIDYSIPFTRELLSPSPTSRTSCCSLSLMFDTQPSFPPLADRHDAVDE
jgi:hypothetical protein